MRDLDIAVVIISYETARLVYLADKFSPHSGAARWYARAPDFHPPTFPLLLMNVILMQTTYLFGAGLPRSKLEYVPDFFRLAGFAAGCPRLSDEPQPQLTQRLPPAGTLEAG